MKRSICAILVIANAHVALGQNEQQQLDEDAFYALQRKEKHVFVTSRRQALEQCKVQYPKWFKPGDPQSGDFLNCKKEIGNQISQFEQGQQQAACVKFQFRCN